MATPEQIVEVDGRRVRLSNVDRVMYPASGTTKGEVISYYAQIAPLLLPHVAGRPLTRKRWPGGVDEPSFFAKEAERGMPEWITRHAIDHASGAKDYPIASEAASLVYFAQVASLELHVPQWRFDARGARSSPDRLVLDLDPGPGVGLAECAHIARVLRDILDGMGMQLHPVTSGSKGIHLYAGLDGTRSSDDIVAFAHELARAVEADQPELVVSSMTRSRREGRILIDWSQNNAAKTTIAPYSLRGREQPTVAAPRTWAELDDPALSQLLLDDVLERMPLLGDLLLPLDASRFVIREHHARREQWELCLERAGVRHRWTVPRGIPASPDQNHLAIMTATPPREDGSAAMTIWDSGTFTTESWRDDEVIIALHGQPSGPLGTVRLALIRTGGDGETSSWLLHRMATSAAPGEPDDPRHMTTPVAITPPRVITAPPPRPLPPSPMLAASATVAEAERAADQWSAPWAEFKWDGIRAVGMWDGAHLSLFARSGTDITARYPELTNAGSHFGPDPVIFDGEIVALDASGRPNFSRLQKRIHLTKPALIGRESVRTPVTYFVFDLITDGPLSQRRARRDEILADAPASITAPPVIDDVAAALSAARELNLEGIVVKNPQSLYHAGRRSADWLKVKLVKTQDVVIAGISPGEGGRTGGIGSLMMGIPGPEGLEYVGRVGTGFTESALRHLAALCAPLHTTENALIGVPAAEARTAQWLRPELVGEIEYAEFTGNGHVRHARWRGLRPDIRPADVTRDH